MKKFASLSSMVFITAAIVFTACSSVDRGCVDCVGNEEGSIAAKADPSTEFDHNVALWRAKRPANYEMTVAATTSAIMATSVVISVQGETAISMRRADPKDIDRTDRYKSYDTVEKLFDLVRSNLKTGPERFSVTYDAELGYPNSIKADPLPNAVDDEYTIRVISLQAR